MVARVLGSVNQHGFSNSVCCSEFRLFADSFYDERFSPEDRMDANTGNKALKSPCCASILPKQADSTTVCRLI